MSVTIHRNVLRKRLECSTGLARVQVSSSWFERKDGEENVDIHELNDPKILKIYKNEIQNC